jgi:hypothetical protein
MTSEQGRISVAFELTIEGDSAHSVERACIGKQTIAAHGVVCGVYRGEGYGS